MLLTFHSRTLSRKRNTLWTLFLTVAILLVLQFYFERVMSELQDINAYIPFIDEDEEKDDGYVHVKHSEAPSEPLNKAGSQINSEKREECFESSTTKLDKNKNRKRNQNTAGCMQNDKSHPVASGGFNEAIHTTSTHPKKYKDQNTVNKSHKDNKYGNNMEIIPSHKEEQANSGEKKYDIDGSIQDKWEQYDNQAKHEKSSFKRKAMTGDNSPVQECKDQAEICEIANGDNTQSTERAGSISSHEVNPEEKNVGNSGEANDEGPDTYYFPEGEPIKQKPNSTAIDNDKPEKEKVKAVESEQDGRSGRKNNDNGYDVDTGKHEKECKENSKQEARNRLQLLELKNNAAEGSNGDASAYYSKDNQDAVSLKTTRMHYKCSSSSKQEKKSKAKKDIYHTDELSMSGIWNRESINEQDDPDTEAYWKAREKAMEKYVYFWRSQDVYSQWHTSNFHANGQTFTCAEQYMMYKKAELFEDFKLRGQILKTKEPRKMKALGRKVSNFDEPLWRSQCLYVVKEGNIEKFSQNKEMEKELFDTYPRVLVEASPYDQIWGIGLDAESPGAYDESKWNGLNLLGFILTEVRDELMFKAGWIEENQKKVYLEGLREIYCAQLEQYSEYSSSSAGDYKTEERKEASRSKPGSDGRHKLKNDNNGGVDHGETKISKAEPTKKGIGTWENNPGSDCKQNKNKNIKGDESWTFKAEPTDNISKRYLKPSNDDEKSQYYFDGNEKPPTRGFPGQETSEKRNEAKEVREMPDVRGRQKHNKQSSQMTTKTIGSTSFNNTYVGKAESLKKGQLSCSYPGVKSGGEVRFDLEEFPPLTHDVVNKTKFQRKIRKKKKNEAEVKGNIEEKESKIRKHVVDINERSEEVTHVDHTSKEVFDQFDNKMDGMESFVHLNGTEEMQQFDENAKPAYESDSKKGEGFNTDSKKMVKEEKEKSHENGC